MLVKYLHDAKTKRSSFSYKAQFLVFLHLIFEANLIFEPIRILKYKSGFRMEKTPAEDPVEENEPIPAKAPKTILRNSKRPISMDGEPEVKKLKLGRTNSVKAKKLAPERAIETGTLHCFGSNDCGQLGFKCTQKTSDVPEETSEFPTSVPALENKKIIAVACGGIHTTALEDNGIVWTFGQNDDKALGRPTENDEDALKPEKVNIPKKVVQVSAGDSHTAALTEDGEVYIWGCFKDHNGNYGLVADDGDICREEPQNITSNLGIRISKISSGTHHIAMLGEDGSLYTCGTGGQGQLGRGEGPETRRITRSMTAAGIQTPKEFLLTPSIVRLGHAKLRDIWTGEFSTYCVADRTNEVYVFGLNNYGQLGVKTKADDSQNVIKTPTKRTTFKGRVWKQIAAGQHHAVALSEEGKVFTLGRNMDGRLGNGTTTGEPARIIEPTEVIGLPDDKKCILVAAGGSTSYAVTDDGAMYSWGFGENYQLATGDDKDRNVATLCCGSEDTRIEGRVVNVAAGGMHVALTIQRPTLTNGEKKGVNGQDM